MDKWTDLLVTKAYESATLKICVKILPFPHSSIKSQNYNYTVETGYEVAICPSEKGICGFML